MAESGGNPNAYNGSNYDGSNDAGLMQINSIHGVKNRFDPQTNMDAAYTIYRSSGWRAWSAYNNKRYERFL